MTTLAEYNNNPGNIRPAKGVKYEGLIGVDDNGFGIFKTRKDGQQALLNDLTYKLEKRGIRTPSEFVDIYSPAGPENSEDSRDNYKIYIAQKLGLKSTNDPFPENAVDRLAQAVSAFEGGSWQSKDQEEEKKPERSEAPSDPTDQYSGEPISNEPTQAEKDRSAKEMGAVGAALGTGAGSVYAAKAPLFRLAQRVGLFGGKPITPQEAATLAERVMTPSGQAPVESVVRKPHGGENWQKSLTGISTPGAQMDKASLDLAKGMQQTVGIGGAPGFTGGTITPGGIILSPRDAAAVNAQQQAAAQKAAMNEIMFQQSMQRAGQPDIVQRGARAVMRTSPVRGGMAGLGVGFNAQDAYNKFQEGDTLGGALATGAAGASGLTLVPRLAPVMGPAAVGLTTASQVAGDLRRGDRQGAAESGLTGLTAMFPRIFGPLGTAVYSRGLNEGEEEELRKRRMLAPTISP